MQHVGLILDIFQYNIFLHYLNIFIVDLAPLRCCKIAKVSKIMSLGCFLVLCSFFVSLESSSLTFMYGYESELVLHVFIGRKFSQGSHFVHVKNLKGQEIGSGLSDTVYYHSYQCEHHHDFELTTGKWNISFSLVDMKSPSSVWLLNIL